MKNTRRPLWRDLCWGVAASVTSALLFALDSGSFRTIRHDFLLSLSIEAPMAVMANLLGWTRHIGRPKKVDAGAS